MIVLTVTRNLKPIHAHRVRSRDGFSELGPRIRHATEFALGVGGVQLWPIDRVSITLKPSSWTGRIIIHESPSTLP
jgi:hypothetical protein